MSGSITLADVAKAAGVSLGTASNAFNRPEKVRLEVQARVEAAARALSYSGPDPKGRLLMGGRVNAIGVLAPTAIARVFEHAYLREFMTGAAEVCDELGAALVTISGADEEAAARGVRSALVDGFILHKPEHMPKLVEIARARRLPFVTIDSEPVPEINSIHVDSRGGAHELARHLLGLGHRRFAILSFLLPHAGRIGPLYYAPADCDREMAETFVDTREMLLGYAEALAGAGISINQVPVVEAFPTTERDGARMLLDAAPDATAVLAMSDDLGIELLIEAGRRGIVVPRDLSVVGFDNIAEAATAEPPLTTIAQPIKEKSSAAARIILGPPGPPRHEVLPVRLIVRASTSAPPAI